MTEQETILDQEIGNIFCESQEQSDREWERWQKAAKETKLTQTAKQADIRYRVEIKSNGIVVYKVVSSNGVDEYDVTVFEGKVSGCNCISYKPCYHMRDVQAREDARRPLETSVKGTLNGSSQGFRLMR